MRLKQLIAAMLACVCTALLVQSRGRPNQEREEGMFEPNEGLQPARIRPQTFFGLAVQVNSSYRPVETLVPENAAISGASVLADSLILCRPCRS